MSFEARLVEHVRGAARQSLDRDTVDAVILFLQDSFAVGLSGSRVVHVDALKRAVLNGPGEARVWGSGEGGSAAAVAMVNAYQIHNQEWDCVHEPAVVHPMAVILSVLTAAAEHLGGVSGERFLRAVSAAVDVAAVLGMSTERPMRFFRPGWCGGFGAVAGLALLYELSPEVLTNAWGLAYSAFGGTMQAHREGAAALPLQIAFNARSAVNAVDLARSGVDGPRDFLSGEFGFFALIESGERAEASFAQLGSVSQIQRVSHKPFPTGRAAHGGLDGIAQLQQQRGFAAAQVAEVVLRVPPLVRRLVDRPAAPTMTAGYARLCFPYLAATMLLQGTVSVTDYTPALLADPQRQALAKRVRIELDDNPDPNALAPQALRVRLHDGGVHEIALPEVLGSPERPLSARQHREKFFAALASARYPLSNAAAEALFDAVAGLPRGNTQPVTALLGGASSPST